MHRNAFVLAAIVAFVAGTGSAPAPKTPAPGKKPASRPATQPITRIVKSDAEWKRILPPETYHVMRQKGTEIAFTGKYWNNHKAGTYRCAACDLELFGSKEKFDSGTGWPSFWASAYPTHVRIVPDTSTFGIREEVVCARCDGHLGDLFDDGPKPTGLRYCLDSVSLKFVPTK